MNIPNQPTAELVDNYLHGLLDDVDSSTVERLCREDATWADALAAGRQRLQLIRSALPPTEPAGELARRTIQLITSQEKSRRHRRMRGWAKTIGGFALAAALLVSVQLWCENTKPPRVNLEILGQQALLADSPGSLRVLLTDHSTRQPLSGVPVNVALTTQAGGRIKLGHFTTDAHGTGNPMLQMPDWPAGNYTLKVTADGPEGADTIEKEITLRRDARLMLSTDKPLYQPGQTIHARALALRRPDLKPVANQPAIFTLTDSKGNMIFKKEQPSSRFGIAAADCELAIEAMEGTYSLKAQIGTTESSTNIEVRKYVLPKFKIDVTFDKPYYRPGDSVHGEVKGTYFFGQPVADGTLTMEVRSEDPGRPVLDKRTVKTDPNGTLKFDFVLPNRAAGRPQDQGDARLTLTAVLRDTAGQEASRLASRVITSQDLRIEAIPEAGQFVVGLENVIYVYVSTPDGQPAKAKVRSTFSGKIQEVETNALGVASILIRPEPDSTGAIQLTARDDQGRTATRSIRPELDLVGEFLVRTDKAVYTAGDTMHVNVLANGNQPIFVDLIRDGQTLRTELIDVKDNQGKLDLDLPPEMAGTLQLCAYRFRGDGLPVRKMRTMIVKPPQNLQVKLAADKPEYRPGETAKVTFTLTDAAGKPTPGALSLAAVDEAVYHVLTQRPGLEHAFYLLEQELLKPVATIYPWSYDDPLPEPDRNQFELALFASTARTVPPVRELTTRVRNGRTETVEQMAGPHSLVFSNLPEKLQAFEITKFNRLANVHRAWIALGLGSIIAVYVALCQWIGTFRIFAFTIAIVLIIGGALLMFNERTREKFRTETTAKRTTESAAMAPDMMPAPNEMVRLESRSDSKSAKSEEPLRVRDQFPETLLWQPELVTDDNGNATLEIPLADSITTWRMSASAVAADGRLGALQSGIRVFQPFFVDMNLPVSLTRNDEVSVPVVVSNFLDLPQTVSLTMADANWCERTGDAIQSIDLPPRAVRSISYRLKILKAGRHQLEITARGQGVADAVRRSIEVVPDGRPVEQVVSGTLDQPINLPLELPAEAIPDSARLLVRLYPSAFSQLVEGLDSIFQMPYGCFEQTSSTTYPNILALQYLKRTKQSNPQIEAKARQYIHLGYQRLVTFEVPGGGFDWYGSAPADVPLTAYGLREFIDMAQVHDVDPNLVERTRRWLLSQRKNDGSWSPGRFRAGVGEANLMTTAYVASAVFDGKSDIQASPSRDYLLHHSSDSITDPYTLAQVALALQATGAEPPTIEKYLERLLLLKKSSDDGKKVWWEIGNQTRTCFYGSGAAANIEATALAAQALMKSGRHPGIVRGALTWLVSQKDQRGTWHSTQATVLALQALTTGTGTPMADGKERCFAITFGDYRQDIAIPASQAEVVKFLDLTSHWSSGHQQLNIVETSGTGSGYQVLAKHYVPGQAVSSISAFQLEVTYDRDQAPVGDFVRATALLKNTGDRPAPMVILDLPVPGGFAAEADDFTAMVKTNQIAKFQVTPRQVIVYLRQLDPGQTLTLNYRLKATMPVSVAVNGARAYEYYNPANETKSTARRLIAVP